MSAARSAKKHPLDHMRESIGADPKTGELKPAGPTPATLPIADQVQTSREIVKEIPLAKIRPDPDQPRKAFDPAKLAELAASLKAIGQQQPAAVSPAGDGTFLLIWGERRFRASEIAGLKKLTCKVLPPGLSRREKRRLQMVENLQRKDLTPLEEAAKFREMADEDGLTQREIAEELSISQSEVAKGLALLKLPDRVRRLLAADSLTASVAYELRSLPPEDAERIAEGIAAGGLTRDQVKALVKDVADGVIAIHRESRVEADEPPEKGWIKGGEYRAEDLGLAADAVGTATYTGHTVHSAESVLKAIVEVRGFPYAHVSTLYSPGGGKTCRLVALTPRTSWPGATCRHPDSIKPGSFYGRIVGYNRQEYVLGGDKTDLLVVVPAPPAPEVIHGESPPTPSAEAEPAPAEVIAPPPNRPRRAAAEAEEEETEGTLHPFDLGDGNGIVFEVRKGTAASLWRLWHHAGAEVRKAETKRLVALYPVGFDVVVSMPGHKDDGAKGTVTGLDFTAGLDPRISVKIRGRDASSYVHLPPEQVRRTGR